MIVSVLLFPPEVRCMQSEATLLYFKAVFWRGTIIPVQHGVRQWHLLHPGIVLIYHFLFTFWNSMLDTDRFEHALSVFFFMYNRSSIPSTFKFWFRKKGRRYRGCILPSVSPQCLYFFSVCLGLRKRGFSLTHCCRILKKIKLWNMF